MARSNGLICGLLIAAVLGTLAARYAVSSLQIGGPLGPTLTVTFWALVVIAVIAVITAELHRRERIRTLYIGRDSLFNCEAGIVPLPESQQTEEVMARTLDNLHYSLRKPQSIDGTGFHPQFLVRSKRYHGPKDWSGEVVVPLGRTSRMHPFTDEDELGRILDNL